jgi:hypothetical protein
MTLKRSASPPTAEGLFVVETYDGPAYLGELEYLDDQVVVYTGYVGRPPVISRDEISAIVPAQLHPDVVVEQLA